MAHQVHLVLCGIVLTDLKIKYFQNGFIYIYIYGITKWLMGLGYL